VAQRDRFLDAPVAEGLKRAEQELRPFWRDYARPVEVHFPVAGVARQIAHQLGTVPSGFLVVFATDVLVAQRVEAWTEDLAYVASSVNNARAVLIFYTLREEPITV
jgi:hypothetical protein